MKSGESEQENKDYKRIAQFVYKDISEEPGEGGFLKEVSLGKSSSHSQWVQKWLEAEAKMKTGFYNEVEKVRNGKKE